MDWGSTRVRSTMHHRSGDWGLRGSLDQTLPPLRARRRSSSALALVATPRRDGRDLLPADPEPAGDFELRHRRAVADGLGYPALELQALCLELLP